MLYMVGKFFLYGISFNIVYNKLSHKNMKYCQYPFFHRVQKNISIFLKLKWRGMTQHCGSCVKWENKLHVNGKHYISLRHHYTTLTSPHCFYPPPLPTVRFFSDDNLVCSYLTHLVKNTGCAKCVMRKYAPIPHMAQCILKFMLQ